MRRLAALTAALLAGTSPVLAADFTVSPPVTDTTGKTLTGTETGIVESGATLETSGTAIGWQGPSPAPGVTINHSGTIRSTGGRAIDTSGGNTTRNLTLNNNAGATISATSDTFRINSDVVNSTVTINNSGRIVSTGDGQALDFNAVASATANVQINNKAGGVIEAVGQDAIRPGQGTTVTNSGMICVGTVSGGVCSGGTVNESHDGVDWQ